MAKVRVLFLSPVDADNTNAQSLTAREITLRLDPERFQSTLFYERTPDPRFQSRSAVQLLQLPARRQTARILREMLGRHDLITYVDYSPASYLFLHLPRLLRRRAKAVFHAEAPRSQIVNPTRTLRFLHEGIYPRCDFYTGVTEFVARDIRESVKKGASYVLSLGVDTKLFTPPAERINKSPVVLFAGTLIERKGPQHVVEAARQFPNARFWLVGAGRQGFEVELQHQISQSGLKNIELLGSRTQSQMLDIMRRSDIFLLPSRLEGMPKVTLEAAATGLPCIVFRDYETPSVIDGVTGFQVGTLGEMMQALGQLIDDRSLRERMGVAAREHMKNFDWDTVSRQWQTAYLEMAAL